MVTECYLCIQDLKYCVGLHVDMGPQDSLSSYKVPCIRAKTATGTQYKLTGKNSLHLFKLD